MKQCNRVLTTFIALLLSVSFICMPRYVYADETETYDEEVKEELDVTLEEEGTTEEETTEYEEHMVAVITKKVDVDGNPLAGAKLQILDMEENILDEWVSTLEEPEHETLLPEGEYILREEEAPEGYEVAEDQTFTVEVVINEINAGTDHDVEICEHHHGIPLYYVESEGVKQEVYCINQGWDEPDDINYNGEIVTVDNITSFVPDYDKNMTNQELYDKVLDVVYHRSKIDEVFPGEYTNVESRYITEYAIKNYTSADVESQNGINPDGSPIMIKFMRYYTYDPSLNSKYRDTPGEGDAFGNLAKHWWVYHRDASGKRLAIPEKYATLYYYLVGDTDHHPEDMHLYVYSTNAPGSEDPYQNLLGITWFNPYDENHVVNLEMVDEYSTELTDVTITKVWDDNDNQDGIRPESIEVTLSNGDTVTLNEGNNWTGTIKDLPKYNKGEKINYTWSEVVTDGYELVSNITNDYVTTLTNKHTPEVVTVTINKTWDDYDDISLIRPKEIVVELLANEEAYEVYTLTYEDDWTLTINDLPKYLDGKLVVYTVNEYEIPEYETKYESEDEYTLIIINHHELGRGGDDTPPPQTGITNNSGSILVHIIMFILSMLLKLI